MENPEIKLVLVLILSFVYFGLHLKKIILIACIFKICCDIQLLISLLAKAELSPFEKEWEPIAWILNSKHTKKILNHYYV